MKIFYHIDNDGKCAGFWVYQMVYPDQYRKECIPINYDVPFPFEKINKNEKVYIVDYSILPEEMDRLFEITSNVTWIDHHKSAIERYKDYDKEIRGVRYDGVAGCMLTFCYLHFMTQAGEGDIIPFELNMVQYAPLFTKLIADYDVWTFEYGDQTRGFEKGFSLYPHEPTDQIWGDLFDQYLFINDKSEKDNLTKKIAKEGHLLIKYRRAMMKSYCKANGFEAMLENSYKVYAVNMAMMSSDDFVIDNVDDYDLLVGFSCDGHQWRYSFRSAKEKIDCAKIAERYGGGGHKGAAGCNTKDFILKRI